MSDLDKALSDYTTTICNLLDAEFPKPKPPIIYVGQPINIYADGNTGATGLGNFPAGSDGGYKSDDELGSERSVQSSSTTKAGTRKQKKPKTTNPLKVMGKLTVLATLVYAVFTFLF